MPLIDKAKIDIGLAAKARLAIAAEKEEEKRKKSQKSKEELPIVKYLKTQVRMSSGGASSIEIVFVT